MSKVSLDRLDFTTAITTKDDYLRLALAFNATGGGIWDYDLDSDRLFCSDRWYKIFGLDPRLHRIDSREALKPFVHPEDVAQATELDWEHLHRLLEQDERYFVEFRIVRPDTAIRWLRSVASLVHDSAGHMRAVGCVTDITEFRDVQPRENICTPHVAAAPSDPRDQLSPSLPASGPLSDKELECLLWVSLGKTAWETAAILGRSQRTIEFHLQNAIRKLNAANKIHAAILAIRMGLL